MQKATYYNVAEYTDLYPILYQITKRVHFLLDPYNLTRLNYVARTTAITVSGTGTTSTSKTTTTTKNPNSNTSVGKAHLLLLLLLQILPLIQQFL